MQKFDYYVGIDVSKLTLDVTILCECNNSTKTEYYKIENNERGIAQFVKKQFGNHAFERILFCFENTGVYSSLLASYLHEAKIPYWHVPAMEIKRSKGITRGKDDKNDSKDIAFYACYHKHKFRPTVMPAKSIQQLRLLFTEREKLLKSLASFGRTTENKDFVSKEVFNAVASVNRSVVKQLKQALRQIEEWFDGLTNRRCLPLLPLNQNLNNSTSC
jgi:hypothetical protein